ncbi:MAG: DJ-1/PfpI family protein [Blastocatellia bacterium]|nr:DJ-1/PfpI family protein [Blastocatellia bacterium]
MSSKNCEIVVFLYPGMTALDAIGPYEVLRGIPHASIRFVGLERGPVTVDSQVLRLHADFSIQEVTSADILVIPGGSGTEELLHQPEILEWVRTIHATTRWTTSVCTGSLLLGAAGLLAGQEATSHWGYLDKLPVFQAQPLSQRIVRAGKIFTAAGVSAGIDMALVLLALEAGETVAQAMQLVIEYAPEPPFESGSLETAPEEVIALAKLLLAGKNPTEKQESAAVSG